MKNLMLLILTLFAFSSMAQLPVLKIGDKLPENSKTECATSGLSHELPMLAKENGLLIVFSCNTCPFVVAWEDRFPVINEIANNNKIGFTLVNSNYLKRDGADSFVAMKAHAKDSKYMWPYLFDEESEIANSFGAQTTPHVFLFDKNLKLVYKGTIDDNHKNADSVKEFYLKDALNSLGSGSEVKVKETKNIGCGIKRKTS